MTRISVFDDHAILAGWFDLDRATVIDSGTRYDGSNVVPVATGSPWVDEYLIRTSGGRWVIRHNATRYCNGSDSYRFVSDDEAREWMIRCEVDDETMTRLVGQIEEESGPPRLGRPEIGPQIKVRLPEDVIAAVDDRADAEGLTRSAWIRRAVESALG
jgi:hypothetical protein